MCPSFLFQRGCQQMKCPPEKQFVPGNRCETAVKRVRGLGYHLRLMLRPIELLYSISQASTVNYNPFAKSFTTNASASVTSFSPWDTLGNTAVPAGQSLPYVDSLCDYSDLVLQNMTIRLDQPKFVAGWSVNITTVPLPGGTCFAETYGPLLDELLERRNVTSHMSSSSTTPVKLDVFENTDADLSFLQAVVDCHIIAHEQVSRDIFERNLLSRVFTGTMDLQFSNWTVKLKAIDLSSYFHSDERLRVDANTYVNRNSCKRTYRTFVHNQFPLFGLEHLFIPFNGHLLCAHASFDPGEFEVKGSVGDTRIIFPYYFDEERNAVVFEETSNPTAAWLTPAGRLEMCVNTFLAVFPTNVTVLRPRSDKSLVRQIMSAVCGSISVVFLVAISVTYALFRQLRSLPGLNNMALSLSLGTAQLVLVIPWHRTGNSRMCSVLGVATHWAWLMALSWMGVCCQHMVRVFVSKTRHDLSERQVRKIFARRLLLTVVLSGSIVAATIVVSLSLSGGARIGYGGTMCFLDTSVHQLLILAFLVPLGLVVIWNIGCFIFTVAAIMRVRRLLADAPYERRDVLVYAKLVTVTGGAWILGLLAELLDQEWMRVMAELCTTAQGLLLFLAYVCNARVWNLYREMFGSTLRPSASSGSATVVTVSSSHS